MAIALWASAAASAAESSPTSAMREFETNVDFCLPPHGPATDPTPSLRLAPAPMSSGALSGGLASIIYRVVGGGNSATLPAFGPLGTVSPIQRANIDGGLDLKAGRNADAERQLAVCRDAAAQAGDRAFEAACTNNLALVYAATGRLEAARKELDRAIALYREPHAPPENLANPYASMLARINPALTSNPEAVRAVAEATATQWRDTDRWDTLRGLERSRLNLGNLLLVSGRVADAESELREVWEQRPTNEVAGCSAAAGVDYARLQRKLGRPGDADAVLARSGLAIARKQDAAFLVEPDAVRIAVAGGTGSAAPEAPRRESAQAIAGRDTPPRSIATATSPLSLSSYSEPAGRFDDSAFAALHARAVAAGDAAASIGLWRRLALRADAGKRPDLAYAAHAALARAATRNGDLAGAILEGKHAANLAQAVRTALDDRSPTREARRAFLRERRQVYVALAQALLDAGRLREAEMTLQLLKEDEGQQFMDRPATLGTVALTAAEQAAQREDDEAARQLREAEQARSDAATHLFAGGNFLRGLDVANIEATRLRLGLDLLDLPGNLRQIPPSIPTGGAEMQRAVADLRDFYGGPGRRTDRLLAHLIEDLPAFGSPVSAADRERLARTQQELPRLRAELMPLLANIPVDAAPRINFRRPGTPSNRDDSRSKVWDYPASETAEAMWRSIRLADRIEARALERPAGPRGGAAAALETRDDTLALMARQPSPTAQLYYLPSAERLDVLVVAANGRRHVRLALPQAELDRVLKAFSEALHDDRRDPTPAAAEAYRVLFAPIEAPLAESGAKMLALSLAGRLRWVPFAALHDGRGWLVERYALAVYPGGALEGRLKPATSNWRVAAFGATAGGAGFGPLGSVRSELSGIVRRGATGVLPGDAWLDSAFTAERLRSALAGDAQLVHIASHFKFAEGDAAASFLLLGDGSTLSLRELAGPRYRFDQTELVTLSACETGVSADDAYGQEVDGLAALLMGQGAPAVLASLWQVNDFSTAALMSTLYQQRESRHLSRASALQQAQLSMIRAGGDADTAAQRSVTRVREPGEVAAGAPDPNNAKRLGTAHPFHWAAFVLMGDWL